MDDDRIEIDLADRRFVEQQATDGAHNPDQGFEVERRRTAKAFEERGALECLEFRQNFRLVRIRRQRGENL